MSERSSVRGQVALVTGGGAGIGAACVARFAQEGARVAVVDRDAERGSEAVERAKAAGGGGIFLQADAAAKAEVQAAFGRTLETWGRLDILVNCAGGFYETHAIEEVEEREWDAIFAWNLKSVYLCCREAAGPMKKAGYGRIVNVSSLAGRAGVGETSLPYGAAKAGILGFTRRLAVELAPSGITVNAVAPGVVLSPRVAEMHKDRMPQILAAIPMGRVAEAEEIADGVWYLSTPGAGYITGVTLDINGGRFMG